MQLSYPPIRVHIWGGLGSQLYAWALLISLRDKFPKRRLIAIFHNGGVTRRESELHPYMHEFHKSIVRDYSNTSQKNYVARNFNQMKQMCFGIFRIPFRLLGFISGGNTDEEFSRLRPWVVSLRGHYSNRKITRGVSSKIGNALFQEPMSVGNQSALDEMAVHFRLGDLLHLESKQPIKVERLAFGIGQARKYMRIRNSPVSICSDSVDIAKVNLEEQCPDERFVSIHLSPRETIYFLGKVSCFIGTPSKISEWITIFRVNSGSSLVTFLPRQMNSQVGRILEDSSHIHYY